MTTKSLLIGLDGAEPNLIKHWISDGILPNLARLAKPELVKDISTPPGFGDGVFWASLITGTNVGKHGHFFPLHFDASTYDLFDFSLDTDLARAPFWHFCSSMDRSVGIIDIYTSPLISGLKGIQVMDWMIHDRTGEPRSWPSPLIDQLHEHYMLDPLGGNSESEGRTEQQTKDFQQGMLDRIVAKKDASIELLRSNDWDLFCLGFCDAHDVGHQSWDFANDEHGGAAVKEVYQALDHALGDIIDAAQAKNHFIVAGLGMERQTPYNSILQLSLGHFCGVHGDRKTVTDKRREMPYFELPHNMNSGAVRINLKGRESKGIIAPDDYDKVVEEVCQRLRQIRCAESGLPIVSDLVKVRETFRGGHIDALPDILAVWNRETRSSNVRLDADTTFEVIPIFKPELRTGDHSDRALLISSHEYSEQIIATEAIAPTVCRTLGVNLPDTDAQALTLK